jgi:hypothetical protein
MANTENAQRLFFLGIYQWKEAQKNKKQRKKIVENRKNKKRGVLGHKGDLFSYANVHE